MIRCAIFDDNKEACERLEALLKLIGGIEVISTVTFPEKDINNVCKNKPDLLFVDVEMPVMTGFDVIYKMREKGLDPGVVFTTGYNEYAIKAIKEGAFDYILKPVQIDELKECINRYKGRSNKKKLPPYFENILTKREREILTLICEGKTNKEIASELYIGKTTVDTHRRNILTKTGCRNIVELVIKAR